MNKMNMNVNLKINDKLKHFLTLFYTFFLEFKLILYDFFSYVMPRVFLSQTFRMHLHITRAYSQHA